MRRRQVLALLGSVAAAGCSGIENSRQNTRTTPGQSTDTSTPSDTVTPTDESNDSVTPGRDQPWSLVEYETVPLTASLTSTRWRTQDGGQVHAGFDAPATSSHPAILRGQFTNTNGFSNTFRLREIPLLQSVPGAMPGRRSGSEQYTYRDALVLAPTENHELATTVPDWKLSDADRWRLSDAVDGPWFPERHRMAPGESFTFEYAIVGRRNGDGFPPARYHFRGYHDRDVVFDVWETDRPGPTASSRFEGTVVPPVPETEEMAWYHDAGPETTVYLDPASQRLDLPETVAFTLVNHSHETVSGNPYFWRLWKLVDGEWFHVAPRGWPVPILLLAPGDVERWTLAAFNGHAADCDDASPVGFLGGGRYAFEIGLSRGKRTHAALLDVNAPPAALQPMDGLTVTREDGRVRVEWPRREGEVPRARLTLTRVGTADRRLITEQVMQDRNAALRNTLPYLVEHPDVERVVLVTDRNTVSRGARTGGYEDGRFRFRYREQAYEASADFEE